MTRFRAFATSLALLVPALAFAPGLVSPAGAVTCVGVPGGGYGVSYKTLDSSPARIAPYEACSIVKTYSPGSSVLIFCKLTNNYGNLWYKVTNSDYIYSGHFASTVQSKVPAC